MSQLKVIELAAAFRMRSPAGLGGAGKVAKRGEEIVGAPATIVPIAAAENRWGRACALHKRKKPGEGSEPLASLNKNTTLIYERESPCKCSRTRQSRTHTHTQAESEREHSSAAVHQQLHTDRRSAAQGSALSPFFSLCALVHSSSFFSSGAPRRSSSAHMITMRPNFKAAKLIH